MGWENPPLPWREFERRLSWRDRPRPVTRLPTPPDTQIPDGPDPGGPGVVGQGPDGQGPDGQGPGGPDPGALEPQWAELHCHSSYSFLDGASSPAELAAEARRLGLAALAITDHDGMYGTPQFAQAAARLQAGTPAETPAGTQAGTPAGTRAGLRTVFGAELSLGWPAGPPPGPGARSRGTSRP
jgi:error-prone DNA polymerase